MLGFGFGASTPTGTSSNKHKSHVSQVSHVPRPGSSICQVAGSALLTTPKVANTTNAARAIRGLARMWRGGGVNRISRSQTSICLQNVGTFFELDSISSRPSAPHRAAPRSVLQHVFNRHARNPTGPFPAPNPQLTRVDLLLVFPDLGSFGVPTNLKKIIHHAVGGQAPSPLP